MYIPLGYLGSRLFGLTGLFAALVIANVITALVARFWVWRYLHTPADPPAIGANG